MSRSSKRSKDLILIHGVNEKRGELHVLRHRGDKIEPGVVKPIEEGKPIFGDLVRLKPKPEFPLICEVEEILRYEDHDRESGHHSGPPRVTTEAFRRGWDAIFGKSESDELTN